MKPNETDSQNSPAPRLWRGELNTTVSAASQRLAAEVTGRFGVMPNFFRSASAAEGLIENLWAFAKAAYLDSPLPALFKERLFVYLSRFCPVRYCIVRHVGFLIGQGYPAGDPTATPETVEQVIALLKLPLPDATALAAALTRLEAYVQPVAMPAPATPLEADLFAALALMFVEPRRSGRARAAVQRALGTATFELLTAYLAFVRTAHYWTETHPELTYEPDMVAAMAQHGELAQLLLDPTEAERVQAGEALHQAQADLHQMQGALADREAQLEVALVVGQMATWRWEPLTDSLSASPTIAGLFGLPPGERFTSRAQGLRLVHPDDAEQQRALIATAVQTGESWQREFRIIRPRDGQVAWLEERATAVRNPQTGQLWFDGLVWDITERKQTETALRASAARHAFLVRLGDALRPLVEAVAIQAAVTRTAMHYFNADRCYYCEIEQGSAIIRQDASRGDLPSVVGVYALNSMPIFKAVVDTGHPFVVQDAHTTDLLDEPLKQLCIQLQVISFIDVPVIKNDQPVGLLCVTQSTPRAWTAFEVELAVETAERTWAAVERARAEAALRESEERHRTLFDSVDEGVCLFERLPLRPDGLRDYRYLAMNPAMQAMFGIPDLSGQSIRDHFPDEVEDWYDDYDRVLETGQPIRFERASVPHGLVLEMFVTRLEDKSGRRLLAVMQDITVRKRAEAALAESEARFRTLVTASSDVVYAMSADWGEMRYLIGKEFLPATTQPSRTWLEKYILPEDQPQVLAVIQEATRTKSIFALEHRVIRADGTVGWTFSRAIPLLDDQQEIREWFGTASDVTARKQAEEALRQLNATLERRVEERTQALQRSNQELDQFAYIASHDLKAPLRAIRHLAQWIEEEASAVLPPEAQTHLTKLQGRVKRMGQLIDDLLAYSRAGRRLQQPEWVETEQLVHDLWFFLAAPPGFHLENTGTLPKLYTERVPLETVLRNLLGNALKHHHQPQTGRVSVAAQTGDAWVEFTVTDNGPGIAPQFHERIFQVFQSLKPHEEVEGSGMGLAVVKKAVETRGGQVQVESALGQGATFRFTWPLVSAAEVAS